MNHQAPRFEIRPFRGPDDRRACVALQEEVWGAGFSERIPAAILMIAGRLGGVASGAYADDGELLGFVFGLTGVEDGRLVHWSDMLAVRPEWRGVGIGTALKLHQRERLLELGVERAYWTFDPLEARNAWLNMGRLGAVAREYAEDMYGEATSPLHRGIGTDRLVAIWELSSPRVRSRLTGTDSPPARADLDDVPVAIEVEGESGIPLPGTEHSEGESGRVLVPVPANVQELKVSEPDAAARWRAATRRILRTRLDAGWEVREVVRDGNLAHYLLVREDESPKPESSTEADAGEAR